MVKKITVEVAYALPEKQSIITVSIDEGSTAEEAIYLSGILDKYPEIDINNTKIGLFSKLTKLNQILKNKDRVELYRPLIADPKKVRKQRALMGKNMKKGQ